MSRPWTRYRAAWYETRKERIDANAARFGPRRSKVNKDDPVVKALQVAAPEHERTRYGMSFACAAARACASVADQGLVTVLTRFGRANSKHTLPDQMDPTVLFGTAWSGLTDEVLPFGKHHKHRKTDEILADFAAHALRKGRTLRAAVQPGHAEHRLIVLTGLYPAGPRGPPLQWSVTKRRRTWRHKRPSACR